MNAARLALSQGISRAFELDPGHGAFDVFGLAVSGVPHTRGPGQSPGSLVLGAELRHRISDRWAGYLLGELEHSSGDTTARAMAALGARW